MDGESKDDRLLAPSKVQGRIELVNTPVSGFYKVEFTGNALLLMKARTVSMHDVLTALRRPDEEGLPTGEGRSRVRRKKNQRVAIDVVYDILEDRVRVISAFKTQVRLVRRRRP